MQTSLDSPPRPTRRMHQLPSRHQGICKRAHGTQDKPRVRTYVTGWEFGDGGRVTRFSAAQIRLTTLATQEKRGHRRCRRQKAARRLRLQARCWRRRWYLRLLTGRQACSVRRNACWPAREPAVAFCQGSMNLAQVAQASRASRHLAPGHAPASGHAPLERGLGARLSQALVAAAGGSS